MLRWYCSLIFFAIAVALTWTVPVDGNGEEANLMVIGDEHEDVVVESRVLEGEDVGEITDDETLGIVDRHLRRRKPKNDDSAEDEYEKRSKLTKCVCYGKKPVRFYLKQRPSKAEKPYSSWGSSGSSSQRPSGQENQNQGGSANNNNQRPGPENYMK